MEQDERLCTLKAMCLFHLNSLIESIKFAKEGIRLNPSYGKAYNVWAKCLVKLGRINEARNVLETGSRKVVGEYSIQLKNRATELLNSEYQVSICENSTVSDSRDIFSKLNADVLVEILEYLELNDVVRMCLVCKHWYETLVKLWFVWKRLDLSKYSKRIDNESLFRLLSYSSNKVKLLNLSNCRRLTKCSVFIPKIISRCSALKVLCLNGLDMKDDFNLETLGEVNSLEKLDLSGSKISTRNLICLLLRCDNLKVLLLNHCNTLDLELSRKLSTAFSQWNKKLSLSALSLTIYSMDPNLLKVFVGLSLESLEWVSFDLKNQIDYQMFNDFIYSLKLIPNLKTLQLPLYDFHSTIVQSLISLSRINPSISKFSAGGKLITDDLILELVDSWSLMEQMSIVDGDLSDTGLKTLLSKCSGTLKYLCLRNCCRITDKAVEYLFNSRVKLVYLDLSLNNEISDLSLSLLGKMETLQSLILSDCYRITSTGINSLIKNFSKDTQLKHLALDNCRRIKNDAIELLRNCFNGRLIVQAKLY